MSEYNGKKQSYIIYRFFKIMGTHKKCQQKNLPNNKLSAVPRVEIKTLNQYADRVTSQKCSQSQH